MDWHQPFRSRRRKGDNHYIEIWPYLNVLAMGRDVFFTNLAADRPYVNPCLYGKPCSLWSITHVGSNTRAQFHTVTVKPAIPLTHLFLFCTILSYLRAQIFMTKALYHSELCPKREKLGLLRVLKELRTLMVSSGSTGWVDSKRWPFFCLTVGLVLLLCQWRR